MYHQSLTSFPYSVRFATADAVRAPEPAPPALTVSDLVHNHYLPFVRAQKKSWKIDETLMRLHVVPAIGERPAGSIREPDIIQLIELMRKEGLGKASECRVVAIMKHMFNLALRWELPGIEKNPAGKLRTPDLPGRERYLTDAEMARLAQVLDADEDRRGCDAIRLILATGARRNEVVCARWDQVNLADRVMRVPSKSGKERPIRLNDVALALVEALPSRGISDFLFPGPLKGEPTSIFKTWCRVRKAAGIEDVRLHDLRHTFASILVNKNVSLYTVKELLGHSNVKMTERYAHLASKTVHDAAQIVALALAHANEAAKG